MQILFALFPFESYVVGSIQYHLKMILLSTHKYAKCLKLLVRTDMLKHFNNAYTQSHFTEKQGKIFMTDPPYSIWEYILCCDV